MYPFRIARPVPVSCSNNRPVPFPRTWTFIKSILQRINHGTHYPEQFMVHSCNNNKVVLRQVWAYCKFSSHLVQGVEPILHHVLTVRLLRGSKWCLENCCELHVQGMYSSELGTDNHASLHGCTSSAPHKVKSRMVLPSRMTRTQLQVRGVPKQELLR